MVGTVAFEVDTSVKINRRCYDSYLFFSDQDRQKPVCVVVSELLLPQHNLCSVSVRLPFLHRSSGLNANTRNQELQAAQSGKLDLAQRGLSERFFSAYNECTVPVTCVSFFGAFEL